MQNKAPCAQLRRDQQLVRAYEPNTRDANGVVICFTFSERLIVWPAYSLPASIKPNIRLLRDCGSVMGTSASITLPGPHKTT